MNNTSLQFFSNKAEFEKADLQRLNLIELPEHGSKEYIKNLLPPEFAGSLTDFSVSLNPLGPPKGLLNNLQHSGFDISNYPSPFAEPFIQCLSDFFTLETDHFLVTPGSTQLIFLLPLLWPKGKSVLLVDPGYSEYENAFNAHGVPTHSHSTHVKNDFVLEWGPLRRNLNFLSNLGGIVIGSPSSPDGKLIPPEFFEKIYQYTYERGLFLVIDETFIGFSSHEKTLPPEVQKHPGLILVRSLTKFFSIPGIRLGYGIMHPPIQKRLRKFCPPWAVGSLEIETGQALLSDSRYAEKTRSLVSRERHRIYETLKGVRDLKIFQSDSCSLLFKIKRSEMDARIFFQELINEGFLLRNCGNFRGLDFTYFRMGIRSREENENLIEAVQSCLGRIGT